MSERLLFNSLSIPLRGVMDAGHLEPLLAHIRGIQGARGFDAFKAALDAAAPHLTMQDKKFLAVAACHYGKAGHAYLLLKAGVDSATVMMYGKTILPDENVQRLRERTADSATGLLTFDRIMRDTPNGDPAAADKMARDMDFLVQYPERYLSLSSLSSLSTLKPEAKNGKPQRP